MTLHGAPGPYNQGWLGRNHTSERLRAYTRIFFNLVQPVIPGHEAVGTVVRVGPKVKYFKVGDRVAIEAGVPCGQADCDACRTGRYNACECSARSPNFSGPSSDEGIGPRVVFFSTPPYHGTLTRFHAHPASWLHKLPDNVSFEEGALCEPLAVALAGVERAGIRLGDPVVIW